VRLGQVEDLLHRLAEPDAEETAGAERDLTLDRLEAAARRARPRVEERRQALALDRTFAGLVAKGIGIWFGAQTFINMGVNLGLLPTKGLTLPLVSYGGSGILLNCVAVAVLMRVDYENRVLMRGGKV